MNALSQGLCGELRGALRQANGSGRKYKAVVLMPARGLPFSAGTALVGTAEAVIAPLVTVKVVPYKHSSVYR